ncbi:APC family permease [Actinoallomurus acaciae]|uniref:APC family permease n=1 Tax=Actinoallomurus acaciae TaxID=502577 RepID=A0ABV5YGP0_9ACTN
MHTLTPVGIAVALLLLAVAFLVTAFHAANFSDQGFAPAGSKAMLTAISTSGITFSYLGFRQAIELAGESDNPRRNVPSAVVGSVIICMAIYVLLQIAFIGALSGGDLAHGWSKLSFTNDFGPLAAVSTAIGLGWLATILYVDAVVSPGDTGLVYSAVTSRLGYTMARNGAAPGGIGRLSRRGVPWMSLIITFVVAAIMLLPFPSWQQLVGLVTPVPALGRRHDPAAGVLLGQPDHLLDRLEHEREVLRHRRVRVRPDGDLRGDRPAHAQDGVEGRWTPNPHSPTEPPALGTSPVLQ